MSAHHKQNATFSNFSTGDSESEIKGADRIALKKKNVVGFLHKVNINKRKFVRYQTAQHKARLKRRLGIPQTAEEIKELELSKQLASEIQDEEEEYLEQCKSRANSEQSKITSRSAPPYLLQTPGGSLSPIRRGITVKPKDFKRKDDYVFFDLFTLYAETYMGRKKAKSSVIEEDDSELRSQD